MTVTIWTPERILKPVEHMTFTRAESTLRPRSVGWDGWVYGRNVSSSDRRIWRSGDGLETVEYGFNFTTVTTQNLNWVTRTREGYLVCTYGSEDGFRGRLWFSNDFQSGFVPVLEMENGIGSIGISDPIIGKDGNTWHLMGEYDVVTPTPPRRLFMSVDGCQTYHTMITRNPVDENEETMNCHCHCATYYAPLDRVFVSFGDGPNSWFGYLDDPLDFIADPDPEKWVELAAGYSEYRQATVLPVTGHRIGLGPDIDPGINVESLSPRTGAHREDLTIHSSLSPGRQFPHRYWRNGPDEVYILFPPRGQDPPSTTLWIAGTADGGRSWHIVHERNIGSDAMPWNGAGFDHLGQGYEWGFNGDFHFVDTYQLPIWTVKE